MERLKFFEIAREAVDGIALRVVMPGIQYHLPQKTIGKHHVHSRIKLSTFNRIPKYLKETKTFKDLTGIRFGRMTVVGYSDIIPKRWVCRCDCSAYELRSAKAIRNKENFDMCYECRMKITRNRHYEYTRTGKNEKNGIGVMRDACISGGRVK